MTSYILIPKRTGSASTSLTMAEPVSSILCICIYIQEGWHWLGGLRALWVCSVALIVVWAVFQVILVCHGETVNAPMTDQRLPLGYLEWFIQGPRPPGRHGGGPCGRSLPGCFMLSHVHLCVVIPQGYVVTLSSKVLKPTSGGGQYSFDFHNQVLAFEAYRDVK